MPSPLPDDHTWAAQPSPVPPPPDDDTRIAALVAQQLASDWSTRRQQITVRVQNRVVILAGMVSDPETRQIAGQLAWSVTDVVDVCNALRLSVSRRPRP